VGWPNEIGHSLGCRPWASLAILFAVLTHPAIGQGPAFPPPEHAPSAWHDAPSDRDWIRIAQQPQEPSPSQPVSEQTPTEPDEKQDSQLNAIVAQQDGAKKRSEELAEETKEWEANILRLDQEGVTDPKPYSFLLLDKARDDVAAELQYGDSLAKSVATTQNEVTKAKTGQEEAERALHRAQDKLDQNHDSAAAVALQAAVGEAKHAQSVADETLTLRRLELANLKREQHLQSLHLVYAQQKSKLYEQDVVFTRAMLDQILAELRSREKVLNNRTKEIEDDLNKFLNEQWYQARKRLEDARAAQEEAKLPTLEAEVQAKNQARQTALLESRLIADEQEQLKNLIEAWQHRYALATQNVASDETAQWVTETKAALDQLRADAADANTAIETNRKQLASVDRKLQAASDAETGLRYWLNRTSASLQQQRKLYEDALVQMEPARRIQEKLLDELTSGNLTVAVGRWAAEGWHKVEQVWDYELATVDERRITVGKIVQGVFLLFLGIYVSRILSRLIGRRMLSRMGVDASATAALQSVVFYILVMMFTLFALKLVQVPLTVFTVLGGALALGIGFGSQNIVNNFISGLILMAERPVKVGDLIQLGAIYGNVEHIGARSTRVRTGENLEIIVPNSTFLETNVVNWTLSDNNMRTSVTFGVVYGSPLGKVTHLALKAAANHDRVFDRPEPFVTFDEFGDNALVFELHFWVAVRTLMERRKIESDIRFNLDHLYREAGIVIAFPQRDLHLFTERPLQVQMAPPSGDSDAA
jgi:potassium-dependent mechanosensitive channel